MAVLSTSYLDHTSKLHACANYIRNNLLVESEVAGFFVFSHIWMMGYFRLGWLGLNDCPAGLEPPSGARIKKTPKIQE